MARVTPRLPIASVDGATPTATISSSDWTRIESAYGHQISSQLRETICDLTNNYLVFAQLGDAARPVADAEKYLKAIHKAANALLQVFHLPCEADARRYVHIILKQSFSDARLKVSDSSDSLHSLIGVMTSFVVSCVRAENQLSNDRVGGFRPGDSWNIWIQNLRSLLKKNGLPSGYRKDTDKNKTGKLSEFVIFIDELQKCIPREYRRGKTHGTSLTEMISRACRSQVRERWITPTLTEAVLHVVEAELDRLKA